jgi:ABC-type lipoprotein export system ATPase subunit
LLTRLAEDGKTVLMVTHDDDLALRARRVITIKDGEII